MDVEKERNWKRMSCTKLYPTQNMQGLHQKEENTSLYVEVIIKIAKSANETFVLFIAKCFGSKWMSTG